MGNGILNKLSKLFKKEEKIPCIIWDGKKMNYRSLTQNEINEIETSKEYENWSVTIDEEDCFNKNKKV